MLIWCAENKQRISYSQLDEEIIRRGLGHHVLFARYGDPAGAVGDALIALGRDIGMPIPPLNALVINKHTNLPGVGCDYYIQTYLDARKKPALTPGEKRAIIEETIEDVWNYPDWGAVLTRFGFEPLQGDIPALAPIAQPKIKLRKSGWHEGPESLAHISLKNWVAAHPESLGGDIAFPKGKTEHLFASNDRADVVFDHPDGSLAVEVKASNAGAGELERGIFQCVKYRALLRAELKVDGRVPNGDAILVSETDLPADIARLSQILNVRVIIVPKERVQ